MTSRGSSLPRVPSPSSDLRGLFCAQDGSVYLNHNFTLKELNLLPTRLQMRQNSQTAVMLAEKMCTTLPFIIIPLVHKILFMEIALKLSRVEHVPEGIEARGPMQRARPLWAANPRKSGRQECTQTDERHRGNFTA